MTSLISADSRAASSRRLCRGFTLVEMLVVLFIIILMMAILMPLIVRAARRSYLMRQYADLQTVCQALEAYKSDTGDYPRPGGPACLANALVTPGKTRTYLQPKYYSQTGFNGQPAIRDMWNVALAYFPAKPTRLINFATFQISNIYDPNANSGLVAFSKLQLLLGDKNLDGNFVAPEAPAYTGPYILWSAGPDYIFGPIDINGSASGSYSDMYRCDDVANFWPGPWPANPNPGSGQ